MVQKIKIKTIRRGKRKNKKIAHPINRINLIKISLEVLHKKKVTRVLLKIKIEKYLFTRKIKKPSIIRSKI